MRTTRDTGETNVAVTVDVSRWVGEQGVWARLHGILRARGGQTGYQQILFACRSSTQKVLRIPVKLYSN